MSKINIIKLVSAYVSIILGAGFISGKELFFFFVKYKYLGILTLFFSCILFGLLLYKQFNIIRSNNLLQYHDFSHLIFSNKTCLYIENITLLFLFVTVSTMLSAFCQTFSQNFNVNMLISEIIIFIVTILTISGGIKPIVILNTFLTPIMFVGIIIIGIYTIYLSSVQTSNMLIINNESYSNALIFSILYFSFNSLTSIPMMCNMNNFLDSKKTITYTSLLSATILFLLGVILIYPMIIDYDFIYNSDIPILKLLSKNQNIVSDIYLCVFLMAIFSTLISTLISLISTLQKKFNIKNIYFKAIIILLALFFSNLGFSNFVSFVYPIFGILGLIQIYYIFTY